MDFRWVAGMAVWTMLSGPIFVELSAIGRAARNQPLRPAVGLAWQTPAPPTAGQGLTYFSRCASVASWQQEEQR